MKVIYGSLIFKMKRILDFVLKYERRDAFSYCSYSCLLVSNRSHLQKHARDFSYCTKSLFPGWYIHCTWKPTWIWKIPARYFNLQSPNLAFKVHVHKQLWFVVSIFEPFSEKKNYTTRKTCSAVHYTFLQSFTCLIGGLIEQHFLNRW